MSDKLQDGSTINGDRIVHETAEADDDRFIVHQSRGDIVGINLAEFDTLGSAINNLAGETGIETVIVPEGEHRMGERFNELDNISQVVGLGDGSELWPHESAIADGNDSHLDSQTNYENVTFVREVEGEDSARFRVRADAADENRRVIFHKCLGISSDGAIDERVFESYTDRITIRDCDMIGEIRISDGTDIYIDGTSYRNLNISSTAGTVEEGTNFDMS